MLQLQKTGKIIQGTYRDISNSQILYNILVVVHCFSSGRTNMKGSVVNSLLDGKRKMTKNINKLALLDILLVMASVSVKF